MKRSMFGVMFAALLTLSLSVVARASTTDVLTITAGGLTATIDDNGTCMGTGCTSLSGDLNGAAGSIFVTGSIDGWTVNYTSGTSNSPVTTPFGIDIGSLAASCTISGGCTGANTLDIEYSDLGFTGAVPFASGYSGTLSGPGTTTQSAYYSNSNTVNTLGTQIGTTISYTTASSTATAFGQTVTGGAGAVSPYSLTMVETFAGSNSTSFSVDGNITSAAVPEGWSLSSALGVLGFGVVALVVARRRGLVKTTA